ncbi:MAG TPA: SLATT domain-containing protein, partial [Acidimicrobiales bacterium]|nr:SLATT domain-containing protein [Acidimicrobiales bacterium]
DRRTRLREEAQRVEESAMYSAQSQFEYSKTWRRVDRWLGGAAAVLAAASAAGGLSEVLSAQWAGVIALAAAGTAAVAASLGAPKAKDRAFSSANALLALQQDARIFINLDLDELSDDDAREQLRTLVARQQELNATAEIPSGRAWKRSKANIESGTQTYKADQK